MKKTPKITKKVKETVVLKAAINNEENKFREKVRERNTRFTWFDKLSTSTGERVAVIIIVLS